MRQVDGQIWHSEKKELTSPSSTRNSSLHGSIRSIHCNAVYREHARGGKISEAQEGLRQHDELAQALV